MCRFISRPHIDLAASQLLLHNINMSVAGSLSLHEAEAKVFEDPAGCCHRRTYLRLRLKVQIYLYI
jgi:hypothetical protein